MSWRLLLITRYFSPVRKVDEEGPAGAAGTGRGLVGTGRGLVSTTINPVLLGFGFLVLFTIVLAFVTIGMFILTQILKFQRT
jgi:hypothetical protein